VQVHRSARRFAEAADRAEHLHESRRLGGSGEGSAFSKGPASRCGPGTESWCSSMFAEASWEVVTPYTI